MVSGDPGDTDPQVHESTQDTLRALVRALRWRAKGVSMPYWRHRRPKVPPAIPSALQGVGVAAVHACGALDPFDGNFLHRVPSLVD